MENVAVREPWRSSDKRQPLIIVGKPVGLVDFYITLHAQRSLICITYD
jgi:hypothetical protein